ncbi:UDP-N-acetylmuramate--L-alanine ligase [Buchnera aphidicola (Neophyllaphis podocarpi)]|uniref:UDP-N-acetylmuramate--L-alanine ligase n=1 Tax=Buchnera aphidicola TaxID=9 RepID=UPI0031B889FE
MKTKQLLLKNTKKIHFIGIGGTGMGSIATILAEKKYKISGSDIKQSKITRYLKKLGVKIYNIHSKLNINNPDIVVFSSAIKKNNIELITAKKYGIKILHRSEILSEIIKMVNNSIAITGTHGKTTTTSMIFSIYYEGGFRPNLVNGGLVKLIGKYSTIGKDSNIIVEADESDASLLNLKPKNIVITNIDTDHLHEYKGNFNKLQETFIQFANNIPKDGYVIICLDNKIIQNKIKKIKSKIITYGFNKNADLRIISYKQKQQIGFFKLLIKNDKTMNVSVNLPGKHNALNATAAIAISKQEKIKDKYILKALKNYKGTKRRFEIIGKFILQNINKKFFNVIIIDDYGHHPTAIRENIITIKEGWPNRKIIMIFQPHRYTRTKNLFNQFVKELLKADKILILNIFSSGEKKINKINNKILSKAINKKNINKSIAINNNNEIIIYLKKILCNNSVIITQGAGDLNKILKLFYQYKSKS